MAYKPTTICFGRHKNTIKNAIFSLKCGELIGCTNVDVGYVMLGGLDARTYTIIKIFGKSLNGASSLVVSVKCSKSNA